eukprot:CAMPEP_0172597630 /NCGR_PEP_ID=MMETSP1068-20121228/17587_1 /TAXON_ID=35684 /ORGANISM="Pseudopedinella elastica, Strain CCMP716" /LENGTH=41 /DNA_ID= /DNA_START= /DNA_END= /DNA_ORIENTATION=
MQYLAEQNREVVSNSPNGVAAAERPPKKWSHEFGRQREGPG